MIAACGGKGFSAPMTLSGRVVSAELLEHGKDLYNRYCVTCHGFDGKAETPTARQLDPKPRDFTAAQFKHKASPGDALPSDAELGNVVKNGVPGTGMPAWQNLDARDLDAVLQYLKTFSPRWQSEAPQGSAPDSKKGLNGSMNVLPARDDAVSFRAALGNGRDVRPGRHSTEH
ncbi:MAG: cytochrome c [Myxococcota bacterium]